ncbi:MAG: DNA-binding response regulator [Chloroflexi bacterium RIFCSPLOWO2_12_FULL_71_12]|nr:MAG: DNA-binding response regulator [Chloroflexi bacterium RIFCSPLOWO2_12_FULL_71_12]
MGKIRILVADDHTVIRRGIVGLLNAQPDMEVIDEAGTGREAVAKAQAVLPDVVLLDVAMPELNGLGATRMIKAQSPGVQVLILTMHDREDYLFQALRAGASGYVLKGADTEDLLAAVRSVARGGVYLYPPIAKELVSEYLRRVESGEDLASYDGLTDREREILQLIAEGKTAANIAEDLHISPHTVHSHRDNIMSKLDLHDRAALIRYAIRRGLVD